ncbi:MAG: tRNA preQ1(34) S-adenosylmethionine ribosyltransferase-isomerase QueA [Dethiobacteria bacterium]|jgi:S-adenosylmethionine:tRNA ribosyltransferase-isomerase
MRTEEFDYDLPPELIAQEPLVERDSSRMLVLNRSTKEMEHSVFKNFASYLYKGDLLVLNNTRVFPARLRGRRKDTGGKVELLLLRSLEDTLWEVLSSPGKRTRPGITLTFGEGELEADILQTTTSGGRIVRFRSAIPFRVLLQKLGEVPLPPYIKKELEGRERYQTVYSQAEGSAAAPTAGLHFTPRVFKELEQKGVDKVFLTLHIGLGTFRPVRSTFVTDHVMHEEFFELSAVAAEKINCTRKKGGRIIAVGTTCCRVLESQSNEKGWVQEGQGKTALFIYPGYRFKTVDALLTNFHLPRSSLLMLTCAFAGKDFTLRAYNEALQQRYRFYSFGDCMFIY